MKGGGAMNGIYISGKIASVSVLRNNANGNAHLKLMFVTVLPHGQSESSSQVNLS